MPPSKDDDQAKLLRANGRNPDLRDPAVFELIGEGSLSKMVRLALTDPDGELWRYVVVHRKKRLKNKKIEALRSIADLPPSS